MTQTTEELTLRPFTTEQARRVLAGEHRADDRWEGGYLFADENELVREFLRVVDEQGDPAPFGPYLIRRGADGPAIGGVVFFGPPDIDGIVEFAFALVPTVRGNGFATEAVRAALSIAESGGAFFARAEADIDNVPAQRVLLRAGLIEIARTGDTVLFETELPAA
ncbi:GNAT family N-acetyltransferase [Agromyces atrinae]|uniref:RimJ/RimL family protein N-acetyltransferase n=1 Tax=Agromyces atrinae TaxID=592376 RepID=A0A852SIV8_9MICO|nr:GNAT family N-acetyltransferase [Agromyces atrinae]MCI2956774.1 GNAT family N-acetyltransferase [Agromyces atrinae]NYD67871.1 RimJ/RimL family protein N-acetyltransferase [Agromyces atrinae]